MRYKILILAGLLAAAAQHPAAARENPNPPPSGIVIHLFGQNSVMSNVMPSAAAAGAPVAGAAPQGNTTPSASGYAEPSMGDVLHQMFVTGDPNAPQQPSAGRTRQRLSD